MSGRPLSEVEVQRLIDDRLASVGSLIRQLQGDGSRVSAGGADIRIAFGTATVTFAASQNSDLPTVVHDLGRVPIVVVALPFGVASYANFPKLDWFGPTNTTFQLAARAEAAISLAVAVTWIAIG